MNNGLWSTDWASSIEVQDGGWVDDRLPLVNGDSFLINGPKKASFLLGAVEVPYLLPLRNKVLIEKPPSFGADRFGQVKARLV